MSASQSSIALDPGEFALIVGEEDGAMTVRVESSMPPKENEELPEAAQLVVALAQRLLKDPEFHETMLDWFDAQPDEDEDGEDEDEDEE
jgi:hypothetical protein